MASYNGQRSPGGHLVFQKFSTYIILLHGVLLVVVEASVVVLGSSLVRAAVLEVAVHAAASAPSATEITSSILVLALSRGVLLSVLGPLRGSAFRWHAILALVRTILALGQGFLFHGRSLHLE